MGIGLAGKNEWSQACRVAQDIKPAQQLEYSLGPQLLQPMHEQVLARHCNGHGAVVLGHPQAITQSLY